MPLDEADVKVIVHEYLEDKVVFRENCKNKHEGLNTTCNERHKGVDKLDKKVDWMIALAVTELLAVTGGLLYLILGRALK